MSKFFLIWKGGTRILIALLFFNTLIFKTVLLQLASSPCACIIVINFTERASLVAKRKFIVDLKALVILNVRLI